MTRDLLYIDNKILDIEVLADKAKVMIDDLNEEYFGYRIDSESEMWRIKPPHYDLAGIKASIASDIIFELVRNLSNLRSYLDSNDDDVEREIKLYGLMDKHNCDRDVAELLLRDQEEHD